LGWFVERGDDAWWEGGFCERGKERVARRVVWAARSPRYVGERLQRAEDIAK